MLKPPPTTIEKSTDTTFRALVRTYGLLGRVMQPYFARFGISGSQWGMLRALHRAEQEGHNGIRLKDLSARLLIRPPSVTGAIDRLERMGLVARDPSTTDLRAKHVSLTPDGRQLVDRILLHYGAQIALVLGGLSELEQKQLHWLLSRLDGHLEEMLEAESRPVDD